MIADSLLRTPAFVVADMLEAGLVRELGRRKCSIAKSGCREDHAAR